MEDKSLREIFAEYGKRDWNTFIFNEDDFNKAEQEILSKYISKERVKEIINKMKPGEFLGAYSSLTINKEKLLQEIDKEIGNKEVGK